MTLRKQARHELLAASRRHPACRPLREIPSIGPIRAAVLIAIVQTPHRFRTKRQLWAYSSLALEMYPQCCGLDVHKSSITACVLVAQSGKAFALVEPESPRMNLTLDAVENNGLSPSLRRGAREGDFRD